MKRSWSESGPGAPRDTDETPFTKILEGLLARVPGSYAAALVDAEGETVDYAGRGDPFDFRVAAAYLRLTLKVAGSRLLGEPRWVVVRGTWKGMAVSALPEGYALALLLRPRAAFTISPRALKVCARALALEAGWNVHDSFMSQRAWFSTEVETDLRGRPRSMGPDRVPVEVIGAVMGLSVRERGFRIRTSAGTELTLVREAGQRWYADEPL